MPWWDTCVGGNCTPYNPAPNCADYTGNTTWRNDYGVPLDVGTQVASPVNGLVLPQHTTGNYYSAYGQQDFGGEVDILTFSEPYGGLVNVGVIHLDTASVQPGDWVQMGQVIGTSGGQRSGGHWPSRIGSTGPHIGLQVHGVKSWCDIKDPGILMRYLTNPALGRASAYPTQAQLASVGMTDAPQNTPNPMGGTSGTPVGSTGSISTTCAPWDIACIMNQFKQQFGAVYLFSSQPIRLLKLLAGAALTFLGLLIAFLPDIGAALVTAQGIPEAAQPVKEALSGRHKPGGIVRAGIRARGAVQGQKVLRRKQEQARQAEEERIHQFFVEAGRRGGKKAAEKRKAGQTKAPGEEPLPPAMIPGTPEHAKRQEQFRNMRASLDQPPASPPEKPGG